MTSREDELRKQLDSNIEAEVLKAGLELANEVLIGRGDFFNAERVLLEILGLQTHSDGQIVQLSLGKLYIKMNEISRAARFLRDAATSNKDEIRAAVDELMMKIEIQ
jgi:predicted Zn-dependent protease